jgi:RNA polymerase sigma-70 factor, ECF subfamily
MEFPGSRTTVESLVDEHYESLYRYAYRLSGAAADADDLTQETFCKAQACLSQLRDGARARPWLYRILRNCFLHKRRTEQNHPCISLEGVDELPGRLPEPLPPVDPQQLQEALNDLPEVFRTPIILYYFEDLSYREIAEHMDMPLGTVMSRLARGKAYLRNRLLSPDYEVLADRPGRATHGL